MAENPNKKNPFGSGETEEEKKEQNEENPQEEEPQLSNEELRELCKTRLCPECPELQENQMEMLRVKAEAENFKKRVAKEKDEFCKFATENLLQEMLPVIDNLELAIQHGSNNPNCKDLLQGVEMTLKIFMNTLKNHGLEPIGAEGECFDPTWHEAMAEENREDMESGHICQLMQRGYKLKDRLLRPAKVIISKNESK